MADQPYSNVLNLGVVLGVFALARYADGSGLLAELIFGVTLANMPRTPHMLRQGLRMLAFHAELSFLVRSFFFVMLGIVAQFIGRKYAIPILGILAALVLARFLAVRLSRLALRDVTRQQAELLFWMLPRGLVTAVLALRNCRCPRRDLRVPACNGIHGRVGDQSVHRLGCNQIRTGRQRVMRWHSGRQQSSNNSTPASAEIPHSLLRQQPRGTHHEKWPTRLLSFETGSDQGFAMDTVAPPRSRSCWIR